MQIRSLLAIVLLAFQLQVRPTAASSAEVQNFATSTGGHHSQGGHHHGGRPRSPKGLLVAPLHQIVNFDLPHSTSHLIEVRSGRSNLHLSLDAQFTDLIVNSGKYNPKLSPKSVNTKQPFNVTRTDSEKAVGSLYTDTFSIAGLTIQHFPIGLGKNKWLNAPAADGLLGFALAWPSEVPGPNVPFLAALKQSGAIKSASMGLALWKQGGEVSFGGANPKKFKGKMEWVDVPARFPFWSTPGKLGGVDDVLITMDTQRMTVNAPRGIADKIFKTLPGAILYTDEFGISSARYPCNKAPQIMVEFGCVKVPVGGATDVKYGPDPTFCVAPVAGVDDTAVPNGDVIAGAYLYSNLYAVVDMEKGAVGYAARA
ncbi:unnamed protein product [Tilletia controversa]|nr:unnamed protein product [Tilletia controversa]CAD6986383.1 unnamed protein product [Tilletia controversa]